ncbi:MAG: TldD/PmbA family protein [Bacteroidales bacterium]|nr:TldD/PmbA family protein [Bacteroidales bacterium]
MEKITEQEIGLGRECLSLALSKGASAARIIIDKNTTNSIETLNGEIDKVSHCMDKSLSISIFADGRYGSFSTNRIDGDHLSEFVENAVKTTAMLAVDRCRMLPSPERCCKEAADGDELGLYDLMIEAMNSDMRRSVSLKASIFAETKNHKELPWELISEEGEYSDTLSDFLLIDSNGTFCRHTESSFDYSVEMTVADKDGNRYSGFDWDGCCRLDDLDIMNCGRNALGMAVAGIGPGNVESGKYNVVIDARNSRKLLNPLIRALRGEELHQNNSFLKDSLGKSVLPQGLTLVECSRKCGEAGARLFDHEGVDIPAGPVIENGVVKKYFLNTRMSGKLGLPPTVDGLYHPQLLPFPEKGLDRDAILALCGDGIYVTGFNGGNYNHATGNFSYGIEGFAFRNGKITHPVREMVFTGNFLRLWSGLLAVGSDNFPEHGKMMPTLAFAQADLSA